MTFSLLDLGLVSHLSGLALFLLLTVMLAVAWKGGAEGALLTLAGAATSLWLAVMAYQSYTVASHPRLVQGTELLRDLAWFAFLARVLGYGFRGLNLRGAGLALGIYAATVLFFLAVLVSPMRSGPRGFLLPSSELVLLGFVLLPVAGLVLVEQLFRNTRMERRWAIKFLCLGVGAMLAYDFYMYSEALLFKRIDGVLYEARGFIYAMVVPLIAVAAKRNQDWSVPLFVSKQLVFHSTSLLGAGIYLLVMAAMGYYIRQMGGTWGSALQAVFLFGAILLLVALLFSGQVRARLKLFLNTHFFGYKYDYREEWLRFIRTLSTSEPGEGMLEPVIRAIGDIVESPGGVLWRRDLSGAYTPVSHVSMPLPEGTREPADSPMVRFLEEREWVIDLDEYSAELESYPGVTLPGWLTDMPDAWLVAPLMYQDGMIGFVVLARPRVAFSFSWEDTDLLKTVGRQAGSYLALMQATEALAEAHQFDAFNRLSAFVVHDLKNLVAQLSLVVTNARRHMDNPEFVADAIQTVENAVQRMTRLLTQLRKGLAATNNEKKLVDLGKVLQGLVDERLPDGPPVHLRSDARDLWVRSNPEQLSRVLGHLVKNAQEATTDGSPVNIRLDTDGGQALIEIRDRGVGMDAQFVRDRLFRPFETTKGNAGMGIGAYECREFVRALGGNIEVSSQPGQGTVFRVHLPLASAAIKAGSDE